MDHARSPEAEPSHVGRLRSTHRFSESRWQRVATCVVVTFAVWAAYRESPVSQVSDAYYTTLASLAILDGNGLVLNSYLRSRPGQPVIRPSGERAGPGSLPYQLEDVGGHVRRRYPPGSAILSAPLLAAMRPFGYAPVDSAGQYDPIEERRIQKHMAAFIAALFILLVFLVAAEMLPTSWAVAVALLVAFASPAWSSLSRGLWTHTWLVVLLTAAILHLVRHPDDADAPNGVLLATLLSWAFFTRPTAALAIIAVGIYLWARYRRQAMLYGITGLLWGTLFVVWSWVSYGRILHPYYFLLTEARLVDDTTFPVALAGTLISPSRGLLVFCPWILVLGWLLWRYRRHVRRRGLASVAATLCLLHLLLVAASPRWWGGWSYGPRLQSDVLPWLALLMVLSLDAWMRDERSRGAASRKLEVVGLALTVFLGCALHAPGALSQRTSMWNKIPQSEQARAVWDWSDPQFLAWIVRRPDPQASPSKDPS